MTNATTDGQMSAESEPERAGSPDSAPPPAPVSTSDEPATPAGPRPADPAQPRPADPAEEVWESEGGWFHRDHD